MDTFKIFAKSPIAVLCLLLMAFICTSVKDAQAALACYDCHGTRSSGDIRPEDAAFRNPSGGGFQGNHRTHMGEAATPETCSKCHPGSTSYTPSHRNGLI